MKDEMKEFDSKTEYLYGDYIPTRIPKDIIKDRILNLNKNLTEVLNVDFMDRDSVRVNKILDAIKFWEKFLKDEEF